MLLPIASDHHRFLIKLGITAFKPFVLGVKVYNPSVPNTHYFRRKVSFTATFGAKKTVQRRLRISIPVSPQRLVLELVDKHQRSVDPFRVDYLEVEEMPPASVWASGEQHRFMEHAIQFAQKCGYLPSGYYSSSNHEFLIQYLPKITDSLGQELITPARIHRKMPRVQVSQRMFKQFSIPVRVAILAHEGCHFFNNTRSELEADLCGIKYYLDAGFPRIEAVYAATKVFLLHPQTIGQAHVERTKTIIDFIDNYKGLERAERSGKSEANKIKMQ